MSDSSSKTFGDSSQLSDLVPLQGAEGPKRHADLHFRKISKAVKGGHAKCYNCPYPASSVSVIQVENPDGLLIHAVCNACLDKHDAAVTQLKNDFYACAISFNERQKQIHVKGIGGHTAIDPSDTIDIRIKPEDES